MTKTKTSLVMRRSHNTRARTSNTRALMVAAVATAPPATSTRPATGGYFAVIGNAKVTNEEAQNILEENLFGSASVGDAISTIITRVYGHTQQTTALSTLSRGFKPLAEGESQIVHDGHWHFVLVVFGGFVYDGLSSKRSTTRSWTRSLKTSFQQLTGVDSNIATFLEGPRQPAESNLCLYSALVAKQALGAKNDVASLAALRPEWGAVRDWAYNIIKDSLLTNSPQELTDGCRGILYECDGNRRVVFKPCGCYLYCRDCAEAVKSCPRCRVKIVERIADGPLARPNP
jgi:hypothetical protein